MAVQRVFCVFCVSPFSYAWCVAYWRMMCGFCSDSNAASYLPADACARTSHAHFESQLTYGLMVLARLSPCLVLAPGMDCQAWILLRREHKSMNS